MVDYPYLPEGREIKYVPSGNEYMQEAKGMAESSSCVKRPTGAVLVKNNKVIARGNNGGTKRVKICPRQDAPTGTNYEACQNICGQKGHSEVVVIDNAVADNQDPSGADLYLYGHWWCCKPCWDKMIEANIANVYLAEETRPK